MVKFFTTGDTHCYSEKKEKEVDIMKIEEFFNKMKEYEKFSDFHFCVEQLEQFFVYMNMLIEWNEKMNLTAIIEPNEIILKHFMIIS